ncbi:golgin candidate 6 isoform X2 [Aristolochia californica]|uniref:golgin candidate 6 isoform X2 n=1 Tax=Aristolochia californica TaxID=171875 RepID=UPI0035DDA135
MDFKLGSINLKGVAQGVGGFVFGNESPNSNEDSYMERLLDRISNGVLADDRRAAMAELQSLVAETNSAQLAFGAMGFPVLMTILKEERDDVEMVRGALETMVGALTPLSSAHGPKNEVQPALLNSDLLSREPDSISLLLSLLSEDDFYVRYYTLQLLTVLSTHSSNRLQEAILTIPRGITCLMDMLMDREVIRNEALLLLTYLTREAEEIQKFLVFEGAFEKIFSIIKEEGVSEGGVVVQDCLELLNNLLRNNASNQILLKETVGFESLISILKLRKGSAYSFTQQKTFNLLCALETIELLLMGGPETEPGKEANRLSNQTVLSQKKILDHLLMLGVESKWAPIPLRCSALRGIGNLVIKHRQNLDLLANKVLGDDPHTEPALNSILRIVLQTSDVEEFLAAEYVFKCFCEKNADGQVMLVSTMTSQPPPTTNSAHDEDVNMSFGSMLLRGLILTDTGGDLETCCRAASVLSHVLKDNMQCKERVLRIELAPPAPNLSSSQSLMHGIVKCLALASSMMNKGSNDHEQRALEGDKYFQPIILRLLIIWFADCPSAVQAFLDSQDHLYYVLELVSSQSASVCVRGLAAVLLGECVIYNDSDDARDAFTVVDTISQKIGLTTYFLRFEEMQKSIFFISAMSPQHRKPLTRSNTSTMIEIGEEDQNKAIDQKRDQPVLASIFSGHFVNFVKKLELEIRESIVDVFSHPKTKASVAPAELQQKEGESDVDYIKRLKSFVEKQSHEMQDLLARNATLAESLAKTGGAAASNSDQKMAEGHERVQSEALRRALQEATQRIEILEAEKAKIENEASMYRNKAGKLESDLESLSVAYNSLEQASEERQKESDVELNDLLVCLGQEQSKVEKLSARLAELGEDVDSLLDGIGDDTELQDGGEVEDED